MSKNLTRKVSISKQKQKAQSKLKQTEADLAVQALAETMLFETPQPVQQGQPRIILGLDATSSMGEYIEPRKISPKVALTIANSLFAKAPGLQVQLCYFRGDDRLFEQPRQFRVSNKWYTRPKELASAIAGIEHWPGWTQHCRFLRHAVEEAQKQAVHEVVLVSDAFEERMPRRPHGDDLAAARVHAKRLHDLGTKIAVGYKGTIRGSCPLERAGLDAEEAFRSIAEANGGHCFVLRPGDIEERFGEIASQATLSAKGDAGGAQALLEHLRSVPFELNVVGEQVAKCKS
jgi:hypothetical protein